MTLNESQLKSEIRSITDYPPEVITTTDMDTVVEAAKNDIKGITNNYDLNWFDETNIDPNRALMWTSCLFCKVKAGELSAAKMKLDSIQIDPDSNREDDAGFWYRKAHSFINDLEHITEEEELAFGITKVERRNRKYGTSADDQDASLG